MKARVRKDLLDCGEYPPLFSEVLNTQVYLIDMRKSYYYSYMKEKEDGYNIVLNVPHYGPVYAYSIDFEFEEE